MRRPTGLVALFLLTTLLAGCTQPAPAYLTDWEGQAAAHGPMGIEATMDLEAQRYAVVGEGDVDALRAPFDIVPAARAPRTGHLAFFHATVIDVGTGVLIIEDERFTVTNGALAMLPVSTVERLGDGLATWLRADPASKPDVRFPDSEPDLESAWFFADGAPIGGNDLVVEEADSVRILMDGNLTTLTLPIRFDAQHVALDPRSAIRFTSAQVSFASFGYAGNTTDGSVAPLERGAIERPATVFGDDAILRFTETGLDSAGTFRLTQATTADGYALPAAVELRADEEAVTVHSGNVTWVQVRYREHGYTGAAILQNVSVTGSASALVRVPLKAPPWIVETLWNEVGDAGIMAPFLAIPLAAASPFLVLGEALFKGLDCLFNDCPSDHPYPAWMAPGEIGRFYYQVDATGVAPGTYEGMIHFVGANHDPVEVPVRIDVRP